jgi:hypothetical protein
MTKRTETMWIIAEVEPYGERETIRYVRSLMTIDEDGNPVGVPTWTENRDHAARYLSDLDAERVAFSILIDRRSRGQSFEYELETV